MLKIKQDKPLSQRLFDKYAKEYGWVELEIIHLWSGGKAECRVEYSDGKKELVEIEL